MSCSLLSSRIENLHLGLQSGKREASEPVCIDLKISCISTWKRPVKGRGYVGAWTGPTALISQQGAQSTGTEEV